MFGRRRREIELLEAENHELRKRVRFLRATNRYNHNTYMKQTEKCEQLEAENKGLKTENRDLWEKLKAQNEIAMEYLAILELGDCNTCAKKRTKVCSFLPGPGEPVRINCPHYTKTEVET